MQANGPFQGGGILNDVRVLLHAASKRDLVPVHVLAKPRTARNDDWNDALLEGLEDTGGACMGHNHPRPSALLGELTR
jgi:hypothetical protein